jgi:hypothetical protein
MPEGPGGGPRPLASSSLNIEIEINAPDEDPDEMLIQGLTSRFRYVDSISISEEVETVGGEAFDKVVIEVLFESNEVELVSVNDVVSDVEYALGQERIGVTIEAI